MLSTIDCTLHYQLSTLTVIYSVAKIGEMLVIFHHHQKWMFSLSFSGQHVACMSVVLYGWTHHSKVHLTLNH